MKIINFLKSQVTIGLKFWIGVALILAMLFFLAQLYEIAKQQIILNQNYKTTNAIVLHSEVIKYRGGFGKYAGKRYKPKVEYKYVVNEHLYESNNITIINSNHLDEKWAKEIVSKYKPNSEVIAFYNPQKPQKSFLLYEIAFWPYGYAIYGFTLACCFFWAYFAIRKIYRRPDNAKFISEKLYLIKPYNIKNIFLKIAIICLIYFFVGVVLGVAYFYRVNKPYELLPVITHVVYFAIGLFPLIYFGYLAWQSRNLQAPQILTDRPQLKAGENIKIKIKQKFEKAIELFRTEMALICTTYYESKDKRGKDCIRSEDIKVSNILLCNQRYFLPNEQLEYEDEILIPPNVPKSGFSGKDEEFPFHRWRFEITNTQTNGFDFTTKYFVNCE